MRGSVPSEAKTNVKRQHLKEDRTKSFLLLAGLTVVLSLAFFAIFSTPNSRKDVARANHPNLGRAPGGENPDTSHSVTPLLSADTRHSDDNTGSLSPEDIHNTAKQRTLEQASPSFGNPPEQPPAAPRPEPKDYALNRIQFPSETSTPTPPTPPPANPDKLTKASLVFVSATSGTRGSGNGVITARPAVDRNWDFTVLPAGTRLVARLETPVSSAVKTLVVAAIEYNYERDGETVIPAGSKAFGELSQVNEQGFVGIQFHSIQLPDETTQKIEGHAVGLQYQPLRGEVTGRNTGKKFLVRSLTGVGTILAATVGVQGGTGVADTLSNNVLLRERVADNVATAGEQQMNDLAYHQNIVVTVPGNTRFYIVLAKPSGSASVGATASGPAATGNTGGIPGYAKTPAPSVQELRELLELKQELTQMSQQQQKTQNATLPDQQ
jgi:Bacterial conjugation TrbI-like protein